MADSKKQSSEATGSGWYVGAMEHLVGVVQEISQARSVETVVAIVRKAARDLTGADGATFILRDGDQCYYAEENAIAPLWKGKRFPMRMCVSGWVMEHARPAVIEDIYADPRVPTDVYRPTFVKSMAMVPIRRSAPIGAIGNYWAAQRRPTTEQIVILQALADTTSVALQNAELDGQLHEQVQVLQNQQHRIQEQRDTIEVFARALAHDLKEPVRTMRSFSRIASDPTEDSENRDRALGFIHNSAERMNLLIDSVLRYMEFDDDFAKIQESCDVGQALESVQQNLDQLIKERHAVIECDALPTVRAHPAHMVQVLQNLIANAIRHNAPGVMVRIHAGQSAERWAFSVRDNGRGIPVEHAEKIFLPFKRLARTEIGAGLGLSICEKIVTRYGGTIRCESSTGPGANFVFTWPRAEVSEPAASKTSPAQPRQSSVVEPLACMLLVDDMPEDLMLSQALLVRKAKLKCRILTAADGEKALAVLNRERIDLVLLDINMPNIDGFEMLERMRQDDAMKQVSVIMCTGSDYDKDKERAQALGAIGYMLKPASFDKLIPLIESVPTLRLRQENGSYNLLRVSGPAA